MEQTIYGRFKHIVKNRHDATALIDNDNRLSYDRLNAVVDELYHGFPTATPQRIGIVMNHGADMIAAILAVLKSGAAIWGIICRTAISPSCTARTNRS